MKAIFRGWEQLAVYIGVSMGRERKERMGGEGDEKDFVLTGLNNAEVCRFASL